MDLAVFIGVFVLAAGAVWGAGIHLSDATDVLTQRLHLGEAMGGLLLLAVATNLPEIAIIGSAALSGDLGIAIGNILGGIAIQTVVLVVLDMVGVRNGRSLSYNAASLTLVLEGALVMAMLVIVVMASRLPGDLIVWRIGPGGVAIGMLWGVGIVLIGRAQHGLPWQAQGNAPDGQEHPRGHAKQTKEAKASAQGVSTTRTAVVFAIAAGITLIGGIALERSGEGLADHIGMTGVVFGATVLAAATSLPEISTGLRSVSLGDYQLAVSDIFGGNAFLPVLFLVASLLSGRAVIPQAQDVDIYLTGLGALLTAVYMAGLIFRPRTRFLGMGVDSMIVAGLYLVGIVGLFAVVQTTGAT